MCRSWIPSNGDALTETRKETALLIEMMMTEGF